MIIEFSVENWMSFRKEAVLSMVAGRERQHGERLAHVRKHAMRLLPVATIYGANASGKSSLIKALTFVRNLVVHGVPVDKRVPVDPFLLDKEVSQQACSFRLAVLIDELIYEWSVRVNSREVEFEELTITNSRSETLVYSRQGQEILLGEKFESIPILNLLSTHTRANNLFLTTIAELEGTDIDEFIKLYRWFKDQLIIIHPESEWLGLGVVVGDQSPVGMLFDECIKDYDTGISQLTSREIQIDQLDHIDAALSDELEKLSDEEMVTIKAKRERYTIRRIDDKLVVHRMMTKHQCEDGSEVEFSLSQESDGSLRLLDLLPILILLKKNDANVTVVIDEVDRSLHSLVTSKMVTDYLESYNKDSRMQLVISTHDLQLMTQDIFRRDEMNIVKKNHKGESSLITVSEFKDARSDKDLRKSYLQGYLGGIPRLS